MGEDSTNFCTIRQTSLNDGQKRRASWSRRPLDGRTRWTSATFPPFPPLPPTPRPRRPRTPPPSRTSGPSRPSSRPRENYPLPDRGGNPPHSPPDTPPTPRVRKGRRGLFAQDTVKWSKNPFVNTFLTKPPIFARMRHQLMPPVRGRSTVNAVRSSLETPVFDLGRTSDMGSLRLGFNG